MVEMPSRRRILLVLVAALAAVVAAAGALGCGDDNGSDETSGDDSADFPPQFVTNEDIEAQENGSPERALLEWWQAAQFADATGVIRLTSEETLDELGEKNLAELIRVRGKGFQGIEVLGSTESGNDASVRAGLLTFQPEESGAPPPDEPTSSTPTTFEMVDEGGDWLFNSPDYLLPMIENLQASEQQQQDEQQGSEDSGDQK